MNNNRGNNRRRGRGNNRQQGGGQQLNRIDSRARGNAPQLLEKYRKLAHDAHLNGDRVTEEYYLQFADHYFRVLADSRQRQEEGRARREERWQEGGDPYREGAEDNGEFGDGDGEDNGYETQHQSHAAPRRDREDRPRYDDRDNGRENGRDGAAPRAPRQAPSVEGPQPEAAEAEAGAQQAPAYEPTENPFTRDNRAGRGLRPRRDSGREERRPRREPVAVAEGDDASPAFDAAILPPAISSPREEVPVEAVAEEPAPKPRKRAPRKPKAAAGDAGEAAASVSTE